MAVVPEDESIASKLVSEPFGCSSGWVQARELRSRGSRMFKSRKASCAVVHVSLSPVIARCLWTVQAPRLDGKTVHEAFCVEVEWAEGILQFWSSAQLNIFFDF